MEETIVMSRVPEKWIFGYSRNGLPYLMIFQSTPLWKIIKYRKSFQSNSRIDFGYPKIRKPDFRVPDPSLERSSRRVLLDAIQCKKVRDFYCIFKSSGIVYIAQFQIKYATKCDYSARPVLYRR